MGAAKRNLAIWDLPQEVWTEVTNYLGVQSLQSLINACNRVLMQKLVKSSTVKTITALHDARCFNYMHSQEWLLVAYGYTTPAYPHTYYNQLDQCYPVPKASLFPALTSLVILLPNRCKPSFELPASLTHLDIRFSHTIGELSSLKLSTLETSCPSLLHLSIAECPAIVLSASQLPRNLLSFRLAGPYKQQQTLLSTEASWPPNLTHLTLHEARHFLFDVGASFVKLDHFILEFLPVSITELQFPSCRFASDTWPLERLSNLKLLHLHSVAFRSRPLLPPTLTHLSILSDETPVRADGSVEAPQWPEKLQTLAYLFCPQKQIPCTPTITKLRIMGSRTSSWEIAGEELPALAHISSSLVVLEFPHLGIVEVFLDHLPPSITSATFRDIHLDGSSVPRDTTHLHSLAQMQSFFWQQARSYSLVLLTPNAPTLLRSCLRANASAMIALTLRDHRIHNFDSFSTSLTQLVDVPISPSSYSSLPSSLTYLNCYRHENNSPIDLKDLLDTLPNLTFLDTSIRSKYTKSLSLILRGNLTSLIALSMFARAAKDGVSSCASAPDLSQTPLLTVPRFNIPGDIARSYLSTLADRVKFKGVQYYSLPELFNHIDQFPIQTPLLSIHGTFNVSPCLIENGFLPGLVDLDLTGASFLVGDSLRIPTLPPTLTKLHLGGDWAVGLLRCDWPKYNMPVPQLPPSLCTLRLRSDFWPFTPFVLSPKIPTTVTRLELLIITTTITHFIAGTLRPRFTSVTRLDSAIRQKILSPENNNSHYIIATSTPQEA